MIIRKLFWCVWLFFFAVNYFTETILPIIETIDLQTPPCAPDSSLCSNNSTNYPRLHHWQSSLDNLTLGCHYQSLGCHYQSLGYNYQSLGCHYQCLGYHYQSLGCHYQSLGCHYQSLGCHWTLPVITYANFPAQFSSWGEWSWSWDMVPLE